LAAAADAPLATSDPLGVLCDDVRARQLQVLRARAPEAHAGHADRMAAYTSDSVGSMHRVLEASGLGSELIEAPLVLAAHDRRFAFLTVIPSVATLTVARSRALEQSLFGAASDATAELGLLLSLFTILLDGLVDEVPDALAPDVPALAAVMLDQAWATTGRPPAFGLRAERHPVAELLCGVTTEIIRRVVQSDGWVSDPELRRRFAAAARAAYLAEARSIPLRTSDGAPKNRASLAGKVRAKSVHWAVVTALAPLCVRGRPRGLGLDGFERFARALGAFGGWIDDIADVTRDLRDERWSNVLLELADDVSGWPEADVRTALAYRLADPSAASYLGAIGGRLYDDTLARLRALPLDPGPVAIVLADIIEAALETESAA
jgi:hypothetical protein